MYTVCLYNVYVCQKDNETNSHVHVTLPKKWNITNTIEATQLIMFFFPYMEEYALGVHHSPWLTLFAIMLISKVIR